MLEVTSLTFDIHLYFRGEVQLLSVCIVAQRERNSRRVRVTKFLMCMLQHSNISDD
jgi:hypothetical protein